MLVARKVAPRSDRGKQNLKNAPTTRPLCPKMQQGPPVPVPEALCFQSLNVRLELTNFRFPGGIVLHQHTPTYKVQ
jgi:hypothetical protein